MFERFVKQKPFAGFTGFGGGGLGLGGGGVNNKFTITSAPGPSGVNGLEVDLSAQPNKAYVFTTFGPYTVQFDAVSTPESN